MATTTRTLIARMHRRRPDITSPEIVEALGKNGVVISRQRVHSLATKMGITLTLVTRRSPVVGVCEMCHKPLTYPGTTTHARCHYVVAKCGGCGLRFKLTRTERARSKRVYHSRECFQKSRAAS